MATPLLGLLTIVVLFSGITKPAAPLKLDNPPTVINRTRAFNALKAERGSKDVFLTLKNNYKKKITAFQISIGREFTVTEEFIFSQSNEAGVESQAEFSKKYPLPLSLQQSASLEVTVKAVVLDDGSGDGDSGAFEEIKEARLGEEIQIRRTLKSLQRFLDDKGDIGRLKTEVTSALNAPEADTLERVHEVKPERASSQKGLSAKFNQGLENGRENALRKVSEIEATRDPSDSLMKLNETYLRMLSRL